MSKTVTIGEHFRRLFDFKGLEDRASFWPYAAVAFIIINAVGTIILLPMMGRTMQAMKELAAQHPDQSTLASRSGHYSISVQEFMPAETTALFLAVPFALTILLYAAAVVRRLHDRGKSGYWGLMPLPFIIYSSVQMPRLFASVGVRAGFDMTMFFSIFFSNLLYLSTTIWLIVLLAGPSKAAQKF